MCVLNTNRWSHAGISINPPKDQIIFFLTSKNITLRFSHHTLRPVLSFFTHKIHCIFFFKVMWHSFTWTANIFSFKHTTFMGLYYSLMGYFIHFKSYTVWFWSIVPLSFYFLLSKDSLYLLILHTCTLSRLPSYC